MSVIVDYENVEIERAERLVMKNVSFSIGEGEFYYLVGRVGSGKSSLLKTMYADVPIPSGKKAEVLGYNLLDIKRKQIPYLRRAIGIVFQDFQLLNDRSARANLEFVLRATGLNNKSYKMPHELSGGEQQRVVIARALLNSPKLILADEPTGNLDPQTGYQIVSLLHDLAAKGHTVVMATHNLQLVEDFPARLMRCEEKQLIVE